MNRRERRALAKKYRQMSPEEREELIVGMSQEVLTNMIQLRIGQLMETSMIILRDTFGFNEEQLTLWARQMRDNLRTSDGEAES